MKHIFLSFMFFLAFVMAVTFASCTKDKAAEKPVLEPSLTGRTQKISASYLSALVGASSGKEETFGERRSMLVLFTEEGCSTCEKILPAVNDFIAQTRCAVYEYQESYSQGSAEERSSILKKLGSPDGTTLTAGRLVAFAYGHRMASISGIYDLEDAQKISVFAKRYFTLPQSKKFVTRKTGKLLGLGELRELAAEEKDFLVYFERESCPDCRRFSDPQKTNGIEEVLLTWRGSFYSLTTEDSLMELRKPVSVGGKHFENAFAYLKQSGTDAILWPSGADEKIKAEYIAMLVAMREVPAFPQSDSDFLFAIDGFASSFGTGAFSPTDRNVPAFCFYSARPLKDSVQKDALEILAKAYDSTGQGELFRHRAMFCNYLGLDNALVNGADYVLVLKKWLNVLQD